MSRGRKSEAIQALADKRKSDLCKVMNSFSRTCSKCKTAGSKRRLFDLEDGLLCLFCLPEGVNGVIASELERENKERLELEKNKPKPESYGEWS